MTIDRRLFLKQATFYSSVMLFGCKTVGRTAANSGSFLKVSPVNSYVPKRVSWTALEPKKRQAFIDAVKAMKATQVDVPASFGGGGARKLDLWQAQAEVHQWYCSHRNGNFLPWHRNYLYHFELFLRSIISDDFRLPYWDWSADQSIPKELQDADLIAVLGLTRDSTTIAIEGKKGDDQTAAWWKAAPAKISKSPDYDTIGGDRGKNPTSGLIESPYHNMVHVGVGGDMGQVPFAAKDPVFWLHHCNVDRLWSLWMDKIIVSGKIRRLFPAQDVGGWLDENYSNHFWAPGKTKSDPPILDSAKNRSSLFSESLGYNYDTMVKTWELTDIPSDQAIVEKKAPVNTVKKEKGSGLRLVDVADSQLSLDFTWPEGIFDSPQTPVSLRLKLQGLPEPKDSTMSYEASLALGNQTFPLGHIGFFPGAHDAHGGGQIGLSLNESLDAVRALASNQTDGSLTLILKDSTGNAVSIPSATNNFKTDSASYGLVIKTVFD